LDITDEDKWVTIKILRVIKDEIEFVISKSGRFANVPDFVEFAVRKELDRQR